MNPEYKDSLNEMKSAGNYANINNVVEKWIKNYTLLHVNPVDYYVAQLKDKILQNIEDIVIPNLLTTNPNAEEELENSTKEIYKEISDYQKLHSDKYYLQKWQRIYDQKSRDNGKQWALNDHQIHLVELQYKGHRKRFRKLNELARQMFIANNDEVYNK